MDSFNEDDIRFVLDLLPEFLNENFPHENALEISEGFTLLCINDPTFIRNIVPSLKFRSGQIDVNISEFQKALEINFSQSNFTPIEEAKIKKFINRIPEILTKLSDKLSQNEVKKADEKLIMIVKTLVSKMGFGLGFDDDEEFKTFYSRLENRHHQLKEGYDYFENNPLFSSTDSKQDLGVPLIIFNKSIYKLQDIANQLVAMSCIQNKDVFISHFICKDHNPTKLKTLKTITWLESSNKLADLFICMIKLGYIDARYRSKPFAHIRNHFCDTDGKMYNNKVLAKKYKELGEDINSKDNPLDNFNCAKTLQPIRAIFLSL